MSGTRCLFSSGWHATPSGMTIGAIMLWLKWIAIARLSYVYIVPNGLDALEWRMDYILRQPGKQFPTGVVELPPMFANFLIASDNPD
jgi:hypothetical protein